MGSVIGLTRRGSLAATLGLGLGALGLGTLGLTRRFPTEFRATFAQRAGRRFRCRAGRLPAQLHPLAATAGFQWLNLYRWTLVLYDPKLERIVGSLAQRIEPNDEKTSFAFHLVPNVKWHDGQPFTSADVAFTIELAKDPHSGSIFGSRLADIARVTTPDPLTAVFELNKPSGALLDIITKLMILPKHALEALPRDGLDRNPWWSKTPIGTGPFSFVRYETDQFVELKANPAYRNGRPKLDGVINRYFKNSSNAVDALRAGEIQFSYVEADEARSFQGDKGFRVIPGNSWVLNYIGFNQTRPVVGRREGAAGVHARDQPAGPGRLDPEGCGGTGELGLHRRAKRRRRRIPDTVVHGSRQWRGSCSQEAGGIRSMAQEAGNIG